MKRNFMAFIVFICMIVCGVSITSAQKKESDNISVMKVSVKGANVKFKKGSSGKLETEYYGTASRSNYDLAVSKNEDTYHITLNYTGKGMAPTIKEGGVIVKIPDDMFSMLCIKGKSGSGIVLNKINVDTDLVTEHCAVVIKNTNGSNKIKIDSAHDAYEINSVPISEDFYLKAQGSAVQYVFTKQPLHLKFKLAGGYAVLPAGWKKNFSIGLGQPKMTVKMDNGIFELLVNDL